MKIELTQEEIKRGIKLFMDMNGFEIEEHDIAFTYEEDDDIHELKLSGCSIILL